LTPVGREKGDLHHLSYFIDKIAPFDKIGLNYLTNEILPMKPNPPWEGAESKGKDVMDMLDLELATRVFFLSSPPDLAVYAQLA